MTTPINPETIVLTENLMRTASTTFNCRFYDTDWAINDSNFADYERGVSFANGTVDLTQMIQSNVSPADVALDIAGGTNATALRDLLDSGVIGRALVTNFEDRRRPEVKADTRVDHIKGDILERPTWQKLLAWQREYATEGFGLILHRPYGALQSLPPKFYGDATSLMIRMLRPGGIMFTQIPDVIRARERRDLCRRLRVSEGVSKIIPGTRREWPYHHALIIK